jgi:hypothetical protein
VTERPESFSSEKPESTRWNGSTSGIEPDGFEASREKRTPAGHGEPGIG